MSRNIKKFSTISSTITKRTGTIKTKKRMLRTFKNRFLYFRCSKKLVRLKTADTPTVKAANEPSTIKDKIVIRFLLASAPPEVMELSCSSCALPTTGNIKPNTTANRTARDCLLRLLTDGEGFFKGSK